MNATTREFRNVFQLAADWQRQPDEIRDAARSLKITPAGRHIGLGLYSPEQQDHIEQHLQHEGQR
jgi:hypothetical protein